MLRWSLECGSLESVADNDRRRWMFTVPKRAMLTTTSLSSSPRLCHRLCYAAAGPSLATPPAANTLSTL